MELTLANTWNNTWQYMLHTIESKLEKEVQKKYQNLDKKLQNDPITNNTPTAETQVSPKGNKQHRHTIHQMRNDPAAKGPKIQFTHKTGKLDTGPSIGSGNGNTKTSFFRQ
jgi:hypothetical protein